MRFRDVPAWIVVVSFVVGATMCGAIVRAQTERADLIPLPYAICVTLAVDPLNPRLDTFSESLDWAKARRHEIVSSGWVTQGRPGFGEEIEYGPVQILKVSVDETADDTICASEAATAGSAIARRATR